MVDPRAGSKELVAPLRKMGFEVDDSQEIPADIAFTGRGDHGVPVSVGIEFKKLGENISSLRSGRLCGHQLPEMRHHFDHCWLLVEGETLFDKGGHLLKRTGRRTVKPIPGAMGISEYWKRLVGLHLRGGLNPWTTQNRTETLKFIEVLYRVWTDEDFDKHTSHLAIYQAPTLVPVSAARQAFSAWPTIGFRTSKAVEDYFGSVQRAANATVAEWAEILITGDTGKTRRLGMQNATKIVAFLHGQ